MTTYLDSSTSIVNINMCEKDATHVVTETTWGCNVYMSFITEKSSKFEDKEIHGSLKAAMTLASFSIDAEAEVNSTEDINKTLSATEFNFRGDVSVGTPTSIQEAIKFAKEIPDKCRESQKPIAFSIVPLENFCSKAETILNKISSQNINRVSSMTTSFEDMGSRLKGLSDSKVTQKFKAMKDLINFLTKEHKKFRARITGRIQEVLPKIRGGGAVEEELTDLVNEYDQSPFSKREFEALLNIRKKQIETMDFLTFDKPDFIIVNFDDSGEGNKCALDNVFVVKFLIHILPREDPEVFAAKYANRTLPSEERKWFGEISASNKIGAYKRRFLEFAEANKGRKKGSVNSICFVIDLKRSMDDSEKSYDIVLQKDGYTLKQNFTPPGKIDINIIETLKRGLTDHTVLVTHEAMQDFKAELEINLEPYEPREEQANKHFYVPIGDNSKQTTVEFKDLTRWTLYKARFRVWMLIDGVKFGSGSESDLLWFNTLPTSPPSALICQPIISSKSYGLSFNWKKPITIADRVNVDNYQYVMSKDGEEVASGETGDFSLINDSLEPDTTYTFSIKVKGDSLPYTLLETPNNNVTINTALESLPVTKKCKTQGLIPVEALTPEEVQKRVLKTIGQLDAKVDSFSKDLKVGC